MRPADLKYLEDKARDIADNIAAKMDARREAEGARPHSDHNYASEIGHPCRRHLFYARRRWQERKPTDIDLAYRLDEGREMEDRIAREFMDIGWRLVGAQARIWIEDAKISGKLDGYVHPNGPAFRLRKPFFAPDGYPVEIKSVAPQFWESTETLIDIRQHRKFWISGIPHQLNLYIHAARAPFGFLVLATFGKRPRILPMMLDEDMLFGDLAKARDVNAYCEKGETPPPIPYERDVCELCDWNALCAPLIPSPMKQIDPADEILLRDFVEMKEQAKRYEDAKAKLIGTESKPGKYFGANAFVGDIEIRTTSQFRSVFDLPADVEAEIDAKKKPFQKKREIRMTSIDRVGGKK